VYKAETQRLLIQRNQGGSPIEPMYYIGQTVHGREISYCAKAMGALAIFVAPPFERVGDPRPPLSTRGWGTPLVWRNISTGSASLR
jgi:hypothetical protein